MTDTAQLREALRRFENAPVRLPVDERQIIAAARELLTIREAGALIITPDEALVERLGRALLWGHFRNHQNMTDGHLEVLWGSNAERYKAEVRTVLDALRDAMPDGGGK